MLYQGRQHNILLLESVLVHDCEEEEDETKSDEKEDDTSFDSTPANADNTTMDTIATKEEIHSCSNSDSSTTDGEETLLTDLKEKVR